MKQEIETVKTMVNVVQSHIDAVTDEKNCFLRDSNH